MKYGLLTDNGELSFKELEDGADVEKVFQELVDGDLVYKPISEIKKGIQWEMRDVYMVLDKEYNSKSGVRPTMLLEDDLLVGNIIFVSARVTTKRNKVFGLTDEQIELLPGLIKDYIVPENLKQAFGL